MTSRSRGTPFYTQPRQFEPLLPQKALDELAERSRSVVEAERAIEDNVIAALMKENSILQSAFLTEAHRQPYRRLSAEDRTTEDGRVIEPGALRTEAVTVGRHRPPDHAAIPAFFKRMNAVYGELKGLDGLLIAIVSVTTPCWRMRIPNGRATSMAEAIRAKRHCATGACSSSTSAPTRCGSWSGCSN